ncbi:DUF6925 family protein [Stappia indica]|uniref:DUF6925 family protein n=1 Tax=Stappia indica TaxID=538381 RepID=UPI000B2EBD8E|nr:hypothetical protein [Stappia indica]
MGKSAMTTPSLTDILARRLADRGAGWSIGSFGAIAEFHQRPDDELRLDRPQELCRVTEKGGIRLDPQAVGEARAVAFETLSPRTTRWGQGLALCLPEEQAAVTQRAVLSELGPDVDALREEDRDAVLFDMGLAQPQIEFCIRTSDPDLLAILRENAGRSVADPQNPAMAAILRAHPHRTARSKLGRVEVYQMIGGPDTGGVSPDGPHTHVLPKLLRSGRTHSANTPIPQGLVPCAMLHPASAVSGARGEDIAFDAARHEEFQELLRRYGLPDYVAIKDKVLDALEEGMEDALAEPDSRLTRTGLRIALRQLGRQAEAVGRPNLARRIERLRQRFDRLEEPGEVDEERPGH